ncbi:MAG: alpha-ketoglutarate-dependent dioxygenase AlkB [Parvibaculales bacterium]
MDFYKGDFFKGDEHHQLLLEPLSLLVLSGAARAEWQHGIAKRKSDILKGERIIRRRRVSLTFRSLLPT